MPLRWSPPTNTSRYRSAGSGGELRAHRSSRRDRPNREPRDRWGNASGVTASAPAVWPRVRRTPWWNSRTIGSRPSRSRVSRAPRRSRSCCRRRRQEALRDRDELRGPPLAIEAVPSRLDVLELRRVHGSGAGDHREAVTERMIHRKPDLAGNHEGARDTHASRDQLPITDLAQKVNTRSRPRPPLRRRRDQGRFR